MLYRINSRLDDFLSHSFFYFILAFFAVRANDIRKAEGLLEKYLHSDAAVTALRVFLWVLCAVTALMYLCRLLGGQIKKRPVMLLLLLALHGVILLVTLFYGGASGYWINWAAGLALAMALDMGLQRDRDSVLNGFSLALLLWLILNLPVRLLVPEGLNGPDPSPYFVPEWLIGNRVFYYRLAFPALCFEMIRGQSKDGLWSLRMLITLPVVFATVALQRGGTALAGFALLMGMMIFFNRRALPRWANPMTMLVLSVLVFIGLQFLHVQNLFGTLLTSLLHRDVTLNFRTNIWTDVLEIIKKYPLTGIGLVPVSYMQQILHSTPETPLNHCHNQLLEIMLHGGVLALVPYVGMVWAAARQTIRRRDCVAVKTAALLLMTFLFMGTVDIFQNDPLYYPLFILLGCAEFLVPRPAPQTPYVTFRGRIAMDSRQLKEKGLESFLE
ncbi:MAG: O-antigen ligase family protein [Firmicutes bacterium]|nr:O-antigen ligase family protein [Bacillota bacterium]